jgi:hypothetical protein
MSVVSLTCENTVIPIFIGVAFLCLELWWNLGGYGIMKIANILI